MSLRIEGFLSKHEWLIPLALAVLFILLTLPGIEWGLPDGWNPDELIQRVLKALQGEWVFDETNFDYPSLPKYAMYWLGRLVESWDMSELEIMLAARKLSVQIGAGVVVLAYSIARKLGASMRAATLGALLVLTNSELAQHARYAHNDIYLAFFVALAVWASIGILREGQGRGWLYASSFIVGLAASSKYNGGVMLLLPLGLYLVWQGRRFWEDKGRSLETLGLTGLFAFGGYVLGTPKALFWMAFYFKRLIPALQNHAFYGYRPDSQLGLIGQWPVLPDVLGGGLAWAALFILIALLHSVWTSWRNGDKSGALKYLVIPAALLIYDIPIALAYNYPERFFLPMVALIGAGIALAGDNLWHWLADKGWAWLRWLLALGLAAILLYSLARSISVRLLFQNDARIAASEFLAELPPADSIEYTLYPPTLDRDNFGRAHNYPIFFLKTPGQQVPEGKIYEFNTGAAGIEERGTRYLAVDSFTYERFEDDYICQLNPLDCEFFRTLLAGETAYEEIAFFEYRLPAWLPEWHLSFMNPDIRIFERPQ